MTPLAEQLQPLVSHPNVRAFLRVIREGETTQDDDAYRWLYGSTRARPVLLEDFADHPRRAFRSPWGWTSAAGAYQFMAAVPGKVTVDTWTECVRALGVPDFSPASQDLAAVFLIHRRKALDDIVSGRIEDAILKCAREWASLPGSPYGQPTISMDRALATFHAWGGRNGPAPPPQPPTHRDGEPVAAEQQWPFNAAADAGVQPITPTITEEGTTTMGPIAIWAAGELLKSLPSLIRAGGTAGSPTTERNAAIAEALAPAVVPIVTAAVGARNEQEAVQIIKSDPAARQRADDAVRGNWFEVNEAIMRAAQFDEDSRAAAADRALEFGRQTGGLWIYLLGGTALAIVLISFGITMGVLFSQKTTFSDETKALLLGQIVIFGFVTVLQFLFGSNIQNRISAQRTRGDGERSTN